MGTFFGLDFAYFHKLPLIASRRSFYACASHVDRIAIDNKRQRQNLSRHHSRNLSLLLWCSAVHRHASKRFRKVIARIFVYWAVFYCKSEYFDVICCNDRVLQVLWLIALNCIVISSNSGLFVLLNNPSLSTCSVNHWRPATKLLSGSYDISPLLFALRRFIFLLFQNPIPNHLIVGRKSITQR